MKLKNLLSDLILGIIVVFSLLGGCVVSYLPFVLVWWFDMRKFDFIKEIIRISKEFVCGHDFIALYHSLKLTYSVNGEFAINDMLRFVDEYHQGGFLDYFEWKELRRVVLERDFSR